MAEYVLFLQRKKCLLTEEQPNFNVARTDSKNLISLRQSKLRLESNNFCRILFQQQNISLFSSQQKFVVPTSLNLKQLFEISTPPPPIKNAKIFLIIILTLSWSFE